MKERRWWYIPPLLLLLSPSLPLSLSLSLSLSPPLSPSLPSLPPSHSPQAKQLGTKQITEDELLELIKTLPPKGTVTTPTRVKGKPTKRGASTTPQRSPSLHVPTNTPTQARPPLPATVSKDSPGHVKKEVGVVTTPTGSPCLTPCATPTRPTSESK